MGAPQIIMVVLIALGLFIAAEKHGQPRTNHDFGVTLVATAINVGLLVWGGFFG